MINEWTAAQDGLYRFEEPTWISKYQQVGMA